MVTVNSQMLMIILREGLPNAKGAARRCRRHAGGRLTLCLPREVEPRSELLSTIWSYFAQPQDWKVSLPPDLVRARGCVDDIGNLLYFIDTGSKNKFTKIWSTDRHGLRAPTVDRSSSTACVLSTAILPVDHRRLSQGDHTTG